MKFYPLNPEDIQMPATVSPQFVIAASVLEAKKMQRSIDIETISRVLFDFKTKGFSLGEVAFRSVPGGVYSEDVEAFVGRLLSAGYARARSPIEFFDDGLRICRLIVEEERHDNPLNFEAAHKLVEEELQST
jgi:hypothetical protein